MTDNNILSGMSEIINESQVNKGYKDIEEKMIKNGIISRPKDPNEAFKRDIQDVFKNLNIEYPNTDCEIIESDKSEPSQYQSDLPNNEISGLITPTDKPRNSYFNDIKNTYTPEKYNNYNKQIPTPNESDNKYNRQLQTYDSYKSKPQIPETEYDMADVASNDESIEKTINYPTRKTLSYDPDDIRSRTEEQEYQTHISDAIKDSSNNRILFNVEEERQEDLKTNMLAEIDFYHDTLEDDGYDLTRIPKVDTESSYEEVENVHKTLRLKNDRNRYCTFAEEFILLGAYLLEDVFDGKRVWFGRRPDMSGWNNHVRTKLHRMRYDTSKVVSDVMSDHNISSGWRIMMELVPNAIMYSREKKNKSNEPSLDDMNAHMTSIRDFDERE